MKYSTDLFQLIKSLDKHEKRYFHLFSSFYGHNKKYMLVFKAIAKQKEYDEKKIIALFHKEKFAKRFAVTKQYLYTLVLSGLNAYHTNIESQLASYLHSISILYEKGLYSQCEKVIAKAKQLAVKYDLQLPLLELLQWENNLMSVQSFIGESEHTVRELFNKIADSIEQFKMSNNYQLSLSLLSLNEVKMGYIRKWSDIEEMKRLFPRDLIKVENGRLSFYAQYRFYMASGFYFSLLSDYEHAYVHWKNLVQILEVNPHQIKERPLLYFGTMQNLCTSMIYLKRYEECAVVIHKMKMKALEIKSVKVKERVDALTKEIGVWLCIETGKFNEGIELIKSRSNKMSSVILHKGELPIAHYNIAYLYFGVGNYRKANEHLNKILNDGMDIRNDTQCFARIFSLIVHFELGNQDLLEYTVKSTYRFLYKRNKLYKVEKIILDFIQKELLEIHSQKELLKSFEVLLTKMRPLTTDPFEQRAYNYFDFISWLESKIERRAFAEVVREKCANK